MIVFFESYSLYFSNYSDFDKKHSKKIDTPSIY